MTKEELEDTFYYKDGILYFKKDVYTRKKDSVAGKLGGSHGYLSTSIGTRYYLIHRVVFMLHHGYLPKYIDHIDGDKLNNRIENLREATHSENMRNRSSFSKGVTKARNVYLQRNGKYVVSIGINNKNVRFGTYEDLELAELVAEEARDKYYGKFAGY
jgi:hypothetical protein